MKLATDIQPRKSGDVSVTVPATADVPASKYTFAAKAAGQLVCEVENESHIGYLLDTGNFYPVDDDDLDAAAAASVIKTKKDAIAAEAARVKAEKEAADKTAAEVDAMAAATPANQPAAKKRPAAKKAK